MCATCTEILEVWMRTLILATASAIALGFAGVNPVHAAGSNNAGSPAPTAAQTPSTGTLQTATPPAASKMQQTTPSMSSNSRSDNPDMANTSQSGGDWGRVSRADVQQIQQKLQQQGLYHGKIDGLVGPDTKQALRAYQRENGLPATATLDPQTLSSLNGGAGVGSSTPPNSSNDTNMTPSSSAGTNAGNNHSTDINHH
jgi:peptidoglycan hydrolase-like protein with peptidoglycan-binding domain